MLYDLFLIVYLLGCLIGLGFVFKKAGLAMWKAFVPIYNIVLWVKVCGKNWKWYLYFLIPAINIFTFLLLVVETAKAFKRYGFWEQTFAVIFPWIYLPLLGCSKLEYFNPKDIPPHKVSELRDWVDSIVFALVAAVIIRGNVLEFYNIPSSSMEKSLMTGDYLMVSKLAYGPRVAMTPLSLPLVHNVVPLSGGQVESYLDWIKLPYHRYPGLRSVKRYDATVFNYPDGDTVSSMYQSNRSYHDLVREFGRETVLNDKAHFGKIVARPVDKKENFIKRTMGLPGETLEIKSRIVHVDGKPVETPADAQFTYAIRMKNSVSDYVRSFTQNGLSEMQARQNKSVEDFKIFASVNPSQEDLFGSTYYMYLPHANDAVIAILQKHAEYLNIDVLENGYVQLAPNYGLAATQEEFSKRDYQVQNAFLQVKNQLLQENLYTAEEFDCLDDYYTLPLSEEKYQLLKNNPEVAEVFPVVAKSGYSGKTLFPHADGFQWSVDNFGPLVIPAKGMTMPLTKENIELYRRCIVNFEHNTLEVKGDKIFINGKETSEYTFKMDYYWLMGDNRHNSADSRYWGFVPEDHIVGRATLVVWSKDKDKPKFHRARWNRMFMNACKH